MSGKRTELTALEMRKQLLLVESELNRVYLVNELRAVQNGVHHLSEQVSGLGSLISSAGQLGTALGGLFPGPEVQNEKPAHKNVSWLSTLVNGVRTGMSLWATWKNERR